LTVTGQPVATLDRQKRVWSARFSGDGRYVVTAGADGSIRVWRTRDWRALPERRRVRAHLRARAAFTADGRFLVAGGFPGWPNKVWRFTNGHIGPRVTRQDGLGGWIEPDGSARVVDAASAASAARLAQDIPYTFATGPSGRLFVAAGGEDQYHTPVYRTRKGTNFMKLPYSEGASFSPDGNFVAILGSYGIELWDLVYQEPQVMLPATALGLSFSPDGRLVVSADEDTARVWDSVSGAQLAELPPQPLFYGSGVNLPNPYPVQQRHPQMPGAVSGGVAVGGAELIPAFEPQPTAGFSPDSSLVASWGVDGAGAQLWQPFGLRQLARLRKSSGFEVAGVSLTLPTAVSPDGRVVAAAQRDNTIGVWRTRDGRLLASLPGSKKFVSAIAFSRTGDLVAASSHDGFARLWRVRDGHLLFEKRGGKKRVGAVAINPDGTLLASGDEDGTVRVWRLPGGEHVKDFRPAGPVTTVAFSSDGDSLIGGGSGGVVWIWSTGDWKRRVVLGPTRSPALVVDALVSKDGSRVATLDLQGVARLWRSDGGPPLRTLQQTATIAFSPDGTQLLAGGGDATVQIVRTSDGKDKKGSLPLQGHTDTVYDATFTPDGDLVVTAGGDDQTVRVWQAATYAPVAVLTPSLSAVLQAIPAANGRLVTVSDDGVRIYACEPCLGPDRLRELANQRLAGLGTTSASSSSPPPQLAPPP
jgi:WD40 repeat protein